jgi:hypothetical protein
MKWSTYDSEGTATTAAHIRSAHGETYVVVAGPREGEWSVVSLADAIAAGSAYTWAA